MSYRTLAGRVLAVAAFMWFGTAFGSDGPSFRFIHTLPDPVPRGTVVVDARPLRACEKQTIAGAYCLPAVDLLGPHGRLISFRNIFWRLGSAGLSGSEAVIVASDRPEVREFVAGVLYLSGQRKVDVLKVPIAGPEGVPHARLGPPAHTPGATRNPVFEGRVRGRLIVLRGELAHALRGKRPPPLLDGRSLREYWGVRIRAERGGHIPGAHPFPATKLRSELEQGQVQVPRLERPVAYANGPFSSIVYFTLLRAGADVSARVYINGWRAWASDGALPADSVTFPDSASPNSPSGPRTGDPSRQAVAASGLSDVGVIGWLLGVATLLISAALWIRLRTRTEERSGAGAKRR